MKIIVAGSRAFNDQQMVFNAIETFVKQHDLSLSDIEIVSGGAIGVDRFGEKWANAKNVKLTIFKADWNKHGKKAGMIRNKDMRKYSDALIAIWDGRSKGTKHMIDNAYQHNLIVKTVIPDDVFSNFFTI